MTSPRHPCPCACRWPSLERIHSTPIAPALDHHHHHTCPYRSHGRVRGCASLVLTGTRHTYTHIQSNAKLVSSSAVHVTVAMREHIDTLLSLRLRDVVQQVVTIALFLSIVVVGWRGAGVATSCDASIVVVLSGSMEPGYQRGDVLLLHHRGEFPVTVGDIIVYTLPGQEIPIVHRVHRIHERAADHKKFYLTKGDNNVNDDRFLFQNGREWVEEDMILGKTYAYVPRIGYLTIMFNESKIVKYVALGLIGFFLLTTTEEL